MTPWSFQWTRSVEEYALNCVPLQPSKPVRLSAYEMPRKIYDVAPAYPPIKA